MVASYIEVYHVTCQGLLSSLAGTSFGSESRRSPAGVEGFAILGRFSGDFV